ncbi:MAG: protein-L-isoaspartate(D-aspartate) O-methyltransferase [Planctomycetes bacterium]|nr:protein-L-isoaspartate(D-aspartate) O-methyltransferase [Planctomycetota bacterium]
MKAQQDQSDPWLTQRRNMVDEQIRRRRITDPRVLEAMLSVPRERFVPPDRRPQAYEDRALPIGHGQTISQPFMVAYMTEQLNVPQTGKVLEIGTGSGYQSAILSRLCDRVFTIERLAPMHETAVRNLELLDIRNVVTVIGDGSNGLPEHRPYDRILVTAAAPKIPQPLVDQLADGGILILPVGGKTKQTIVRVIRHGSRIVETNTLACRFVRLIGKEGWNVEKHN